MAETVALSGQVTRAVGQAKVMVSDIMTALSTTDYAANDVISDGAIGSIAIPDISPGGSGKIANALLTCENTSVSHSVRTYFFNSSSITAAVTDNTANTGPTLADVLAGYALGWIDFPSLTAKGSGPRQAILTSGRGNVPLDFVLGSGSTTLYYIHVTLDAVTAEFANNRYILALEVQKD